MTEVAEHLKALAEHFAPRDWDYTRKTDIKHIRYHSDNQGRYRWYKRAGRAVANLFKSDGMSKFFSPKTLRDKFWYRLAGFNIELFLEKHRPDGVLNGGTVITFWEEDGEYLQMVQPTVGSLLADFLIAEPEHPHAVKITAELDRLHERYRQRIKNGEVE